MRDSIAIRSIILYERCATRPNHLPDRIPAHHVVRSTSPHPFSSCHMTVPYARSTQHGTIAVTAQLVGSHLRLAVADTGTSVSQAVEAKLWQAFEQASRWQSGTGLGLYHVRLLTEALGGSVGYQANLLAGSGSVFWAELPHVPMVSSESSTAAQSLNVWPPLPTTPFDVNGAVLVAEDSFFIQELTQELLLGIGVSQESACAALICKELAP